MGIDVQAESSIAKNIKKIHKNLMRMEMPPVGAKLLYDL
jgi:hypothetical protein